VEEHFRITVDRSAEDRIQKRRLLLVRRLGVGLRFVYRRGGDDPNFIVPVQALDGRLEVAPAIVLVGAESKIRGGHEDADALRGIVD
jgi:hypothetical protein